MRAGGMVASAWEPEARAEPAVSVDGPARLACRDARGALWRRG